LDIEKAFGQIMKKYRKINNITQEDLAHYSSLDRSFISRLERGTQIPSLTTAFSIAECFEIPLSELIKEIEDELNNTREHV
jgi:transcriptional regulator with XRE-family HTH domain